MSALILALVIAAGSGLVGIGGTLIGNAARTGQGPTFLRSVAVPVVLGIVCVGIGLGVLAQVVRAYVAASA